MPNLSLATAPVEPSVGHRGRIEQLDGIRALAILSVIMNHCLGAPLLWVGVDVFFVLSGFLITGILLRRKQDHRGYYSGFYFRRIFRIQPAYIVSIILYGTFFTWHYFRPWPFYAFFGMNIHPFFYDWPLGLPVWSLAVEEQFYLLWPTVVLLTSERTLLRLSIAAVLFTPVLRFVCAHFIYTGAIYLLTPFRADLLCAGAALAILWEHRSARFEQICRERSWIGVILGFGGLAGLYAFPLFRIANQSPWSAGIDYSLSLIGSTALLAWALAGRGLFYRLLTLRPMRYIGQISYMMYLVHQMVELLLIRHHVPRKYTLFPTLAITIAFASISWFLMERPLINFAARNSFTSLFRMLTGKGKAKPLPAK